VTAKLLPTDLVFVLPPVPREGDDKREAPPIMPPEKRFKPTVMVCVPVRDDERAQVVDRDLENHRGTHRTGTPRVSPSRRTAAIRVAKPFSLSYANRGWRKIGPLDSNGSDARNGSKAAGRARPTDLTARYRA
jgi:hypothetical protein